MTTVTQVMSEYKFIKDYAQWLSEEGRYENWEEAVDRVMSMHKTKFSEQLSKSPRLQELFDYATTEYKEKNVLGSQRALQFGGGPTLRKNERMFNCLTSYCDRPRFFQEAMHWLLCGGGVGFSVQKHHVEKLPSLHPRENGAKTFVIEDSIEGWADSFGVLLSSYLVDGGTFPEYRGYRVDFDYSSVRPEGAMISGGYKAPGPEGLRESIFKVAQILDRVAEEQRKLKPIECYDFVMHMSDAVLSGGVRRSATICVFGKDDQEMMNAKTGDWFIKNPQRGRSNNSVLLVRDEAKKKEFLDIFESVKQFGEPGIVWAENKDVVYNPCVEIGFMPISPSGNSAWQGCVAYDTKLITKDGIVRIGDAANADKKIDVWNGQQWSTVEPIKTGENRKLYRVHFGDGSYLDATENHKFLAKNRFRSKYTEYTTLELIDEINISKYAMSVPRSNVVMEGGLTEDNAYEYGYVLGDGTCYTRMNGDLRKPFAEIYEHEYRLIDGFDDVSVSKEYNGKGKLNYKTVTFNNLDKDFSKRMKYDHGLPEDIFSWDRKSMLAFVAGWFDADGTVANSGVRIYGREDKIRDGQLLLTKLGINASVNLMQKAGTHTNYSIRKNDVWYLQIPNTLDMWSNKVTLSPKPVKSKGKSQVIRYIEELEGLHDSYCFEEPELHQGLFNNVITKQCNLTECNGGNMSDRESVFRIVKAATILGTLQAGYTQFNYSTQDTIDTFEKESLLGVSITGWMENPKVLFDAELLKEAAEYAKEINREVAALIGINPAARVCCTKPSGNASVLLGTSSGIHPHHAKRYFRHIQGNKEEDIVKAFIEANPKAVEDSVWSASGKDVVMSFPITAPRGSVLKDSVRGVELLEYVKLVQNSWVEHGTNVELCNHPKLRHNVSNTITVDDWDETAEYVYENRHHFAGISFLPPTGDKDYAQAPFTEVKTAEEILQEYGTASMLASGLIVDGLHAFNNNLWLACDTVLGRGVDLSNRGSDNLLQRDWVRRVGKFARRYFRNNAVLTTYCLKDVHLLHKWETVSRAFRVVDWENADIKPVYTDVNTTAAMSCHGGVCDINI